MNLMDIGEFVRKLYMWLGHASDSCVFAVLSRPDDEDNAVFKAIDEKRKAKEERVPEEIREAIKRGERPGHKTGAKGVLADYKAFKVAEYETAQHEKVIGGKGLLAARLSPS